jgi:hypothetical protein
VDDCYCGRQPRWIALKFAHLRLKRINTVPEHQDKIGDSLGIALGEGDQLFAIGTVR